MIYIIFILLFIIIGFATYYIINRKKIQRHIEEVYLKENREKFNKQLQTEKQFVEDELLLELAELRRERDSIKLFIQQGEETVAQIRRRGEEQEQAIAERTALLVEKERERLASVEALIEEKKQKVQAEVDAFRELEMQKARTDIETEANKQQKWADAILNGYWEHLAQTTQEKETELRAVILELDEYRKKQQAVNEAILRQRAIDEQRDFYRVCLSEFAIEDIKLLQEIRQKLHTSDNLNKLIYDVYVSKSVQEMVKRVLQGAAPSGIYKITRLKTGEIYIGKSTNVKDRWVQHCKTVYGAGTIAHSILHTTMAKDGLEQFTFELVEEVPKEKLTEREKYWIMFYGSKEYGLNERNG